MLGAFDGHDSPRLKAIRADRHPCLKRYSKKSSAGVTDGLAAALDVVDQSQAAHGEKT
jgi:hypothetical protein